MNRYTTYTNELLAENTDQIRLRIFYSSFFATDIVSGRRANCENRHSSEIYTVSRRIGLVFYSFTASPPATLNHQ